MLLVYDAEVKEAPATTPLTAAPPTAAAPISVVDKGVANIAGVGVDAERENRMH